MTRRQLEKIQVLFYIAAILTGLAIGVLAPGVKPVFEALLWPVLGFLLYTTFTQISLVKLKHSFRDLRFITFALIGNFIIVPLIVFGMISFLPEIDAVRLGVALVLLVPCTDWFITFTHLGGGETERAIAFAPVSLLFQILFLPAYLFLFFGNELTVNLATNDMLLAFAGIIILPLILAFFTEKWAHSHPGRQQLIHRLGWLPVPVLSTVIFMISASQAQVLFDATSVLWYPAVCFVSFLAIAVLLAKLMSGLAGLPGGQARVLAFSLGSRNSFVVLPLALALPESFEITVFIVVLQSLIELFGMAIYVWLVPRVFKIS